MGRELDGNYSVTIKIGPYTIYSHEIADIWYYSLGELGVLGYLNCSDNLISKYPEYTEYTEIWSVLDKAVIEVFPLVLRTQSKLKRSYIKLSMGKLLGAEHIHN